MLSQRFNKLNDFRILFNDAAEKGFLLISSCILALLLANSDYAYLYSEFTSYKLNLGFEVFSVSHFVNDILMALFFLLVGMEIKREMITGHLSRNDQRILPVIAAIGGVIGPVIIYALLNYSDYPASRGWAIPAATDIAFALGVLALFGKHLPTSLRVFLTALAIIDDLIAVLIIALFYSNGLNVEFLVGAAFCIAVLYLLNKAKVMSISLYLLMGAALWYMVFYSGIHATVAGVLLGLLVPLSVRGSSPLKTLEKHLHPYVLYLILPIFAFTNSGVNLAGFDVDRICNTVSLGIILGLFFGKQIGISLFTYIFYKLKLVRLPENATLLQFYGVAVICGVGFTMSLFVGTLAFYGYDEVVDNMKIGVLIGSLLSAIFGGIILFIAKCIEKDA